MNAFDAFFNCGDYSIHESHLYFYLLHLARVEKSSGEQQWRTVAENSNGEQKIEINLLQILNNLKLCRKSYYKALNTLVEKGLIAYEKGNTFYKKSTISFLFPIASGEQQWRTAMENRSGEQTKKKKEKSFPPHPLIKEKEKEIYKEKEKSFVYTKVKEKEGSVSDEPDKPEPAKRFVPPTLEQVKNRIKEKNYSFDAEAFIAFYESKGWYVGKNKMKDWKAAMVTWQKRSFRQCRNETLKQQNLTTNDEWK